MSMLYDWNREDHAPPVRTARSGGQPPVRLAAPPPRRRPPSRRRRRRRPRLNLFTSALAAFLALAAILALLSRHTSTAQDPDQPSADPVPTVSADPTPSPTPETGNNPDTIQVPDWVVQKLLPVNEYSRPGDPLPQINGVVIHYVGNPGTTAEQNRSYFANLAQTGETWASSHFVVGIDGTVIQCVPLDEIAYCSNQRNADTISIECCHPDDSGKFEQATIDALVRLVNWLIETYGLGREDVIRHYDVSGKECPRYYVRNPDAWEALLDQMTFPAA